MFYLLEKGHSIVESAIKSWITKATSRNILSPSIFPTPFHINVLSVLIWLAQKRHFRDTDKIGIQKIKCVSIFDHYSTDLQLFPLQGPSIAQETWISMFYPLEMGFSIVESAIIKLGKLISRTTLNPSTFQTCFHTNVQNAPMWLAQRRHCSDTRTDPIPNIDVKLSTILHIYWNTFCHENYCFYFHILNLEDGSLKKF